MPPLNPHRHSLDEIVSLVREHMPLYRQRYQELPDHPPLAALPIVEQEDYWRAHQQDRREVLTGPLRDGIVVNSGGTTGSPKHSYYSNEEWDSIVAMSVRAYEAAGLRDGDRVANLFAGGNLYASFTLATESLKWMEPQVVQFPLGFSPDVAPAAAAIHAFGINVLMGFPSHLLRIIEHLEQEKMKGVAIDRIIYAGEMFTRDQETFLRERFPEIQICSAGYATVDAGLIGYADAGCEVGEHRVFGDAVIMEIVDEETGATIEEEQSPGRIVLSNLTRRLMPLLRYPTGDLACWSEPPGPQDRKFKLLGRAQESARIAGYSVGVREAEKWLEAIRQPTGLREFQLLVTREERLDRLTFRLVGSAGEEELAAGTKALLENLTRGRPEIYEDVRAGLVHAPQVEWIEGGELIHHPRTGKLLRVVDRRGV